MVISLTIRQDCLHTAGAAEGQQRVPGLWNLNVSYLALYKESVHPVVEGIKSRNKQLSYFTRHSEMPMGTGNLNHPEMASLSVAYFSICCLIKHWRTWCTVDQFLNGSHSGTLAWRTPWTEEPGGLQSMRSQSRTQLSDLHFHFPPKDDNFLTSTCQIFQVTRNLMMKNAQIDDISKGKSNI